ncbi:hypothetical protein CHUAL_014031 [Chamberlinius hualienensis]
MKVEKLSKFSGCLHLQSDRLKLVSSAVVLEIGFVCLQSTDIMFSLFRSQTELIRQLKGADEDGQHDRFNYRKPGVNYDKFPRPIRPKKSVSTQCTDRTIPLELVISEDGSTSSTNCLLGPLGEDLTVAAATNLCGLTSLTGVIKYNNDDAVNPVGQDQLQSIAFAFSHLTMEAGSKQYSTKSKR